MSKYNTLHLLAFILFFMGQLGFSGAFLEGPNFESGTKYKFSIYSPEYNSTIIFLGNDIVYYDTKQKKITKKFKLNFELGDNTVISHNRRMLATLVYSNYKYIIYVIDLLSGRVVYHISLKKPSAYKGLPMALSARGKYLIYFNHYDNNMFRVFDVLNQKIVKEKRIKIFPKEFYVGSTTKKKNIYPYRLFMSARNDAIYFEYRKALQKFSFPDMNHKYTKNMPSHQNEKFATLGSVYDIYASNGASLNIWNAKNGKIIGSNDSDYLHYPFHLSISNDGRLLFFVNSYHGKDTIAIYSIKYNVLLMQYYTSRLLYTSNIEVNHNDTRILALVSSNKKNEWNIEPYNERLANFVSDKLSNNNPFYIYKFTERFSNIFPVVKKRHADLYSLIKKNNNMALLTHMMESKNNKTVELAGMRWKKLNMQHKEKIYQKIKHLDVIPGYLWYKSQYDQSKTDEIFTTLFDKAKSTKHIFPLKWFIKTAKENNYESYDKAQKMIEELMYEKAKSINKPSAYLQYIKIFPASKHVSEALQKVYAFLFEEAKAKDTVEAYDHFIIRCPYAPQVSEATTRAYEIEKKKYTDIGFFGFIGKDSKMNKQARKLLIKAKKNLDKAEEIDSFRKEETLGYYLIAGRIYNLVHDEFGDTDAALSLQERINIDKFEHENMQMKNKYKNNITEDFIKKVTVSLQEKMGVEEKNTILNKYYLDDGKSEWENRIEKEATRSQALQDEIKNGEMAKKEKEFKELHKQFNGYEQFYKKSVAAFPPVKIEYKEIHFSQDDRKISREHNKTDSNTSSKIAHEVIVAGSKYRIEMNPSKTHPYVGEPFVLKVLFIEPQDSKREEAQYTDPKFDGFVVKSDKRESLKQEGNKNVHIFTYYLTPQKEGNFTITPPKIKLGFSEKNSSNPKDPWGFFNQNRQWKLLEATPKIITVLPRLSTSEKMKSEPFEPKSTKNNKWITPNKNECEANGGKIKNNVCISDWEHAKKICKALGGRLPENKEIIKEVGQCEGTPMKTDNLYTDNVPDMNKKNAAYQRCYQEKGWASAGNYWAFSTIMNFKIGAYSDFMWDDYGYDDEKPDSNNVRCVRKKIAKKETSPAQKNKNTIVNINFKSKNIKKNETSKEHKVGGISYKLKTINGKYCSADKHCLDVALSYPIDIKSNNTTLMKAINNITKQMIPNFDPDDKQDYLKVMGLSMWDKMGSVYDYYISLKPIAITDTTYSMEKCSGGYTGGAHGFGGCEYFNYDLKTNKKIKLNDLLRPNTEYQLMRVLEKQFRKANHLSSRESMTKVGLFDNKLEKPDGFYITNQGLHIYYTPGSIAPYATTGSYEGSFDVPYSMVATLLKSDGVLGAKSKKASENRQGLSSFLHSYVNAGNSAYSPSVAARYYASFVHPYFGIRNATRQDILRDKRKYYRKWPDRNYRLTKYTVIDRYQRAGLTYLEVILEIDWRVASRKRGERTGHSVVTMTLVEDGDSYKITAVRNARIQRDIPVRTSTIRYSPDGSESAETYAPVYFSSNGIDGKMECKRVESYMTCTVTATNHIGTGKGGISISFPNVYYRSGDTIIESSRGFNGDVKFYSQGSLLWSTQYGRKINSSYLLLEGWAKRWRRGETKRIRFSLNAVSTPVQVRAVVVRYGREYIAPTDYGTVDQQGYPVKVWRH